MSVSQKIIQSCRPLFRESHNNIENIGKWCPIPKINRDCLIELMTQAKLAFSTAPILLEVEGDAVIVGDIHGNLHDLLRIFTVNGFPPYRTYIFLGDYVDRGNYSIEVLYILFSLMLEFPDKVYLLRGNHEFKAINKRYGLYEQTMFLYDEEVFDIINSVFEYMPVACILNKHFFLVHAGIQANRVTKIDDIRNIKRPIEDCHDNSLLLSLMWSDPTDSESMNNVDNKRGAGFYYSPRTTKSFLDCVGLKRIIRGHEVVNNGFQVSKSKLVLTVFSSSGYCNFNIGTVIIVEGKEIKERVRLNPLGNLVRKDAIKYQNLFGIKPYFSQQAMDEHKLSPLTKTRAVKTISPMASINLKAGFSRKNPFAVISKPSV